MQPSERDEAINTPESRRDFPRLPARAERFDADAFPNLSAIAQPNLVRCKSRLA